MVALRKSLVKINTETTEKKAKLGDIDQVAEMKTRNPLSRSVGLSVPEQVQVVRRRVEAVLADNDRVASKIVWDENDLL